MYILEPCALRARLGSCCSASCEQDMTFMICFRWVGVCVCVCCTALSFTVTDKFATSTTATQGFWFRPSRAMLGNFQN